MRVMTGAVLLSLLAAGTRHTRPAIETIGANDNRTPAGQLQSGVLTLDLDVTRGVFHPDRDDEPGADVLAFAEHGKAPSIPAPLIRVPVGTEVRTTIHNTLPDSTIYVWGLSGARTDTDTAVIGPGQTRILTTRASTAGTFMYQALTNTRSQKTGDDRMLAGAFIVDPPGIQLKDRVFVILIWADSVKLKETFGAVSEILTINGKTWPNTERLTYDVGDTITWRIVNPSFDTHPMHLHGTYFNVLSRGTLSTDTLYSPKLRRIGVTERLSPRTTMKVQWIAPRPGTWLFHCHLTFHVMPHPPIGGSMPAAADAHAGHANGNAVDEHAMHDMGGLVLATTVRGTVAADKRPRRKLRVAVEQYDSVAGEFSPPFSYDLDGTRDMTIPAKPIIVTQNEPISINVVNHTTAGTSVHWHGLEIESYYDGVPGLGGTPQHISPLVAPKDSFLVMMTPPRAGTFIYHAHAEEARQQGGGLFGAFIVTPPGKPYDPEHERLIIIATPRDTGALNINGASHPTITMTAGVTYRLRMINITLDRPAITVALVSDSTTVRWNWVAKDGADLPPTQAGMRIARTNLSIGETMDMLYTPARAGEQRIEIRAGDGTFLRSARVVINSGGR